MLNPVLKRRGSRASPTLWAVLTGYLTVNAAITGCDKYKRPSLFSMRTGCFSLQVSCFPRPDFAALYTVVMPSMISRSKENHSRSNIPNLNTKDVKLLPFIGQRFVAKCLTVRAHTFLKARVHPKTVFSIPRTMIRANSKTLYKINTNPPPRLKNPVSQNIM